MTTLRDRLLPIIAEMRDELRHSRFVVEVSTDAFLGWVDRIEAAALASPPAGEVVSETMINHDRDPHCIGCYVITWNSGDPVAICNECGFQAPLLHQLVTRLPPAVPAWVLDALRTLHRLGQFDNVYDVRERADMSVLKPDESSWDHPDVKAYSAACEVIEKLLSASPPMPQAASGVE